MNTIKKILFFLIAGIILAILIPILIKHHSPEVDINKIYEQKIDSLNILLQKEKITSDSLNKQVNIAEKKLSLQKTNIIYVKQKYKNEITNLDSLTPNNEFLLFASELSNEDKNSK